MMQGHSSTKTPSRSTPSPSVSKSQSYYDESLDGYFGQEEGAESAKVDSVYRVQPPRNFIYASSEYTISSGVPLYRQPSEQYELQNDNYQITYQSSNKLQESTTDGIPIIESFGNYHRVPLTGPMVVRVHPDGTPVDGDDTPLPQDEDLRQYKLSKSKLPNL